MYSVCAYIMSAIYYLRFYFLKDHRRAKPAKHATDACIVAYSDVNDVSYDAKTASDAVNLELQRQDS